MLKQWAAVTDFHISPFNRETVKSHFQRKEDELDCIIAFEVLKFLAREGRIGTIPKRAHRGAIYRRLTNLGKVPELRVPKALPNDQNSWPSHLRAFFLLFSGLAPRLERVLKGKNLRFGADALCTTNVHGRGLNLVNSGFVSNFTVGPDPDIRDGALILVKVFPSFRNEPYLVGLRVVAGNPLSAYTCSCTNG